MKVRQKATHKGLIILPNTPNKRFTQIKVSTQSYLKISTKRNVLLGRLFQGNGKRNKKNQSALKLI